MDLEHPQLKTVTLRDIAQSLGISHGTVSRALHDRPCISLGRRRQIQQTALRMGYRPNTLAVALGKQRYTSQKRAIRAEIAWINYWPKPEDLCGFHEFSLYWKGAFQVAEHHGYRLEEFVCYNRLPPLRLEKILLSRNIRGILIPPTRTMNIPPDWGKIRWEHFNIVRLGYSVPYPPAHVVTSNQLVNSLIAFESMRSMGYKRIGFVTPQRITTRFKAGFFMQQSNLPALERVPILMLPSREDCSMETTGFLPWLEKNKPDAILTDIAAIKDMLREVGYRIPQDIGLAALSVLDGNTDAGIDQQSETIGRAAAELLISMIADNHYGIQKVCQELLINGKWVNGTSLPCRLPTFVPPTLHQSKCDGESINFKLVSSYSPGSC